MPNWCTGSIKLRGKSDDILRFVREALAVVNIDGEESLDKRIEVNVNPLTDICIEFPCSDTKKGYISIWVRNTTRAFIDPAVIGYKAWFNQIEKSVLALPIRQAWSFGIEEDWAPIAEEYNLDIQLYGIDCSMGFVEHWILYKDGTAEDLSPKYDCYDEFTWGCPFPWIGG